MNEETRALVDLANLIQVMVFALVGEGEPKNSDLYDGEVLLNCAAGADEIIQRLTIVG
jgi:hypothetical protein